MTIVAGHHYPERYGDVEVSVQASRFHASHLRNGCGHTPLKVYGWLGRIPGTSLLIRASVALLVPAGRGRSTLIPEGARC